MGKKHTQCPGFNHFGLKGMGFVEWTVPLLMAFRSRFLHGMKWHESGDFHPTKRSPFFFKLKNNSRTPNDPKGVPKRRKLTNFRANFKTRSKRRHFFQTQRVELRLETHALLLAPEAQKVQNDSQRTPGTIDSRVSILVDFF